MFKLEGKKLSIALHTAGFFAQLAAIFFASWVADISANWYLLPMFAVSFLFAYLFFRNKMPHMWFFYATYLVAYAIFVAYAQVANTGSLSFDSGEIPLFMTLILVFSSASIPVFPVSMAYWIYKRRALRIQGK